MNKRGLTLLETLIATVIILISMTASISLVIQSNKMSKWLMVVSSLGLIRNNVYNILSSNASWKATVQGNNNVGSGKPFDCIKNNTSCASEGGAFILYRPDGIEYYNPANVTSGFGLKGVPCTDFDATNGSATCPFRVDISWAPVCTGPCLGSTVLVKVNINFVISLTSSIKFPLNINRFNFVMWKNVPL